jgi:hypothetical protein
MGHFVALESAIASVNVLVSSKDDLELNKKVMTYVPGEEQ